MTKSESITHLAAALASAQGEMPVAVHDAQNKFLNNKYATLGAVIQASRPILAKYRLSLVQFPVSGPTEVGATAEPLAARAGLPDSARGESPSYIGVESILMHESGEFIAERIVIALTEEKGKSRVQAAGSTLTYLRRYSWASILGMYSDEDSDGSSPVQAFAPQRPLDHGPQTTGPLAKAKPTLPPPPVQKKFQQN